MLFTTILGLILGAATVLLVEQWLRAELKAVSRPIRPQISRSNGVLIPPIRRTHLR